MNFSIGDRAGLELPAPEAARQGPLRARRDRRRQARQPRRARPRAQPGGVLRPMRQSPSLALVPRSSSRPRPPRPPPSRRWWSGATRRVLRDAKEVKTLQGVAAGEGRLAPLRGGGRHPARGAHAPGLTLQAARLRVVRTAGQRTRAGCSSRRLGPDRNRGQNGWVYKVGRRAGSNGAADTAGPFGNGAAARRRPAAVVLLPPGREGLPAHAGGQARPDRRRRRRDAAGDRARLRRPGQGRGGRGRARSRLGSASAVTGRRRRRASSRSPRPGTLELVGRPATAWSAPSRARCAPGEARARAPDLAVAPPRRAAASAPGKSTSERAAR